MKVSDKKLMSLWQEAVKKRAGGKCEYPNCRRQEFLNAHHIFSRSRRSVRYDPDNGLSLCSLHHCLGNESAHKDPFFKDTLIKNGVRTKEFFDKLYMRAYTPAKIDSELIRLDLENCIKMSTNV